MEVLDRELVAERLLRLLAQLEDFQLAHHVRARLARVDDVAFDFARFDAVVDRLLAGPVLGVDAGVDDEAPGAEQLHVELPELALEIVLVPAGLGREALGVQTPSLAERGDAAECPEAAEPR